MKKLCYELVFSDVIQFFEGEIDVCHHALHELFDLPDGVQRIWLSTTPRPSKWTHAILVSNRPYFPELEFVEATQRLFYEDSHLDRVLKPLIGKILYIQCEYEIP